MKYIIDFIKICKEATEPKEREKKKGCQINTPQREDPCFIRCKRKAKESF